MTTESGGPRLDRKRLLMPMVGSALLLGFSIWASTFPLTGYQSITLEVAQALSCVGLFVCGAVFFIPEWFVRQGTLLRFATFVVIIVGSSFAYTHINTSIIKLAPPLEKPVKTVTICAGEYEGNCLRHDVYVYCYTSVEAWANQYCSSKPSVQRIDTRGGNKCGYSLDKVTCEPK
jgi:hypothetical protein